MRIPKSILVHGKEWCVKYGQNLKHEGHDAYGLCEYESRTIWICRDVDKSERPLIFLHEIFHAILYEVGVHETSINDDIEEIIVGNLSEYVMENFTLNLKRK